MKRLLLGFVALMLLSVPVATAQADHFHRGGCGPIVSLPGYCHRCCCAPCCCNRFRYYDFYFGYPYGYRFNYYSRYGCGPGFYFGTFGPRGGFYFGF